MNSAVMAKPKEYLTERPGSLVKGEKYRLILRGNCSQEPFGEPVTFIGHTPYPATVIVLDRLQRRLYCGRENLFTMDFSSQP